MREFLLDLSNTSRFDFQLWSAEKGLIFSSITQSSDKDAGNEFGAFHKKIICCDGFQQARFKKNGAVFGIQLRNGTDVMGSLVTVLPEFYGRPSLKNKDSTKLSNITEVRTFLIHLAQIVGSQLSSQTETEKMAEELGRSFEDMYLYSKIGVQTMPLNFSGKTLRTLIEDLLETMRADLAFAWFSENPDYNAAIASGQVSDIISDPAALVEALLNQIPTAVRASNEECFIVNDSGNDPLYRKLHPQPFRFLSVTIETKDHLYGWMGLLSFNMKEFFRQSELKLLKSLASASAVAFENSRLYFESLQMAKKERYVRNIFQKYVPEAVAQKILDRGDRDLITLGEKRMVTLLNVDMRGYSRMSKKLQSEDVVSVLNYFFMTMGSAILKHNGILDKFLGDGILAVFGAPVESENTSLDAALAALEMREEVEKVNAFARENYGVSLAMGVSINTGEAIVGNIGFEKKMEYTVIGGVVNDTFRIQDFTREKPNSILVSKSTHTKIKSVISTRSLGVKTLGANESRMEVFEVVGRREPPAGKA
ncbi:MAG: adenylate/guanylate cyclase domain-containing protein [Desulfobacterales bacterium]|nr:adenylate/guanylate cyclase domain-containing protein [Desulfobacterales bacterium]